MVSLSGLRYQYVLATQVLDFLLLWNFCREGMAVSTEMSGGSHRDLSSHSTSEDEDTKSEKVPLPCILVD